jgi:hypothetical protein
VSLTVGGTLRKPISQECVSIYSEVEKEDLAYWTIDGAMVYTLTSFTCLMMDLISC